MTERFVAPMDVLGGRLLAEVRDAASAAHVAGRGLSLVLSGGSVATSLLPVLAAQARLDWTATDVFWADERAVPATDPESNFGLAKSLWFDPGQVPASRLHRMPSDVGDLDRAAMTYDAELRRLVGDPVIFDLVLLGIGPDGHVASLFPGHPLLGETTRRVAAVTDSPKPPPRRLTLTLPVLAAARVVVIGAFGASKAPIVRDAILNADSMLPAALVARRASRALWLLDDAAGDGLKA